MHLFRFSSPLPKWKLQREYEWLRSVLYSCAYKKIPRSHLLWKPVDILKCIYGCITFPPGARVLDPNTNASEWTWTFRRGVLPPDLSHFRWESGFSQRHQTSKNIGDECSCSFWKKVKCQIVNLIFVFEIQGDSRFIDYSPTSVCWQLVTLLFTYIFWIFVGVMNHPVHRFKGTHSQLWLSLRNLCLFRIFLFLFWKTWTSFHGCCHTGKFIKD